MQPYGNNNPQPPVNMGQYEFGVPRSLVNVTRFVYILHGISILIGIFTGATIVGAFIFGWPSIIAVVINYVKKSDVQGTFLQTHFSWQIRTFWWALLWLCVIGTISFILTLVLVGPFVWMIGALILGIWVCYRILRGWLRLQSGLPMPM